jgi:hypothetical protein
VSSDNFKKSEDSMAVGRSFILQTMKNKMQSIMHLPEAIIKAVSPQISPKNDREKELNLELKI